MKTTPGKRACEGLSPCLSKKRQFQDLLRALGFQAPLEGLGKPWQACLRWPFPPACRRKVGQKEACKGVSWTFSPARRRKGRNRTSRALAIAFSPCLSRKRPSQGLGVRLQWPFPPACRGKGYHETCLSRTRLFQHTPSMFWSPQVEGLCSPITPTVLVGGCPKDKHVPSPEGEEFSTTLMNKKCMFQPRELPRYFRPSGPDFGPLPPFRGVLGLQEQPQDFL